MRAAYAAHYFPYEAFERVPVRSARRYDVLLTGFTPSLVSAAPQRGNDRMGVVGGAGQPSNVRCRGVVRCPMITDRCVPCSLDPDSAYVSSIATDDK